MYLVNQTLDQFLIAVTFFNIEMFLKIFGPVLVVVTFRTPKEAIQLANNTR